MRRLQNLNQCDKLDVHFMVRVDFYEFLISDNTLNFLFWTASVFKLLDNCKSLLDDLAYTYMSHIKENTN